MLIIDEPIFAVWIFWETELSIAKFSMPHVSGTKTVSGLYFDSPSGITSTGHPGVAFLQIREYPTNGGGTAVGGEFIPIDATAVLIAGAQSNALTILSAFVVIGAIAFGTLVISIRRKRN